MRRSPWLTIILALASSTIAAAGPSVGVGPAYEALGDLAVMHQGRIKPLDTLARQVIKPIYGRETIKLPAGDWGPVAALVDWSARPDFWDTQDFILVDYYPLKRMILARPIREALAAIADKATPANKAAIARLIDRKDFDAKDLATLALRSGLTAEDKKAIEALSAKLAEPHRWLSPDDLKEGDVTAEGKAIPFRRWLEELGQRSEIAEEAGGSPTFDAVEKQAVEVGQRLQTYESIRDRSYRFGERLTVMPRPTSPAYLAFTADAWNKATEKSPTDLLPLELDAANLFYKYINDLPREDRALPGKDPKFDARFVAWLKEDAAWIPLRIVLDADLKDTERAGFPTAKVAAFRAAYKALEKAERAAPGRVDLASATALVASARDLGQEVNPSAYPSPAEVARESHFNSFGPFFKAPAAYGLGLAMLAMCLAFQNANPDRRSALGRLGRAAYDIGMLGLIAGIALEVYGFYLRVRITGWAPVTGMYDTVIWVGLVTASLGLIFELITRKVYPATAASGVALLATVLAANVPMLDPHFKAIQPVLRSNYWLTIHVLTEVSSYAAFALAMGLGLIGTLYYLTATYRRSVGFGELLAPLAMGLPMLFLGLYAGNASSRPGAPAWLVGDNGFYATIAVGGIGGLLTVMALSATIGELISRALFRGREGVASPAVAALAPAATSVQTVDVGEAGGAVSSSTRPTVAEIRARAAASRPVLDARALAMQATAAKVKPVANAIYRTMQVGVLLVAAGTILGGLWADVSWGRFWGWDPKEVWALITLLIYLIPLHGRFAGWVNTFGMIVASVLCFGSVMMAWYGVNFVLGVGLHAYGFTEGGGQGIVMTTCAAVVGVVAGAGWRRHLSYKVPATASSAVRPAVVPA